jgi:competence protein ComEC
MEISNHPPTKSFEKLTLFMPLFWLSVSFLAGILIANQVEASTFTWLGLMVIASGLAILVRILLPKLSSRPSDLPIPSLFLIMLSMAALFFGAARYQASVPRVDPTNIAWYRDSGYEILVTGSLADPPDVRDTYTNLRLNVTSVNTGSESLPAHGLILVRVLPGRDWQYGDVVRVRGHLNTPPSGEDFSYRDYLARQGILAYVPDAEVTLLPFMDGDPVLRLIYKFKDSAVARINRIFPEPEAPLLAGILLGDDNSIPAELQQAYKNTGTAHIIAISGFNIAIIAGLFVAVFSRLLGKRKGAITAILGIAAYTILVGASAAVVRAAIMGGLSIFALQMGGRQNGLNTLAFTAAMMSVANPNLLWDVGFQLSFAATLGLILFAQPLQDWFAGLLSRRLPEKTATKIAVLVGEYVLFTWAAQLATLPIIAYQFNRISLVSLIVNPFILPVQPAVMVIGGLALILSFIYLPLGQIVAWVAWPFAAYTNQVVEFFNRLPHGVIVLGEFSLLFVILYYVVLVLPTLPGVRGKGLLRPVVTPAVILSVMGVSIYLIWTAVFSSPDGNLHLTFLDVGSADAILIQTPSGHTLLVNGGESPSVLAGALGERLSPFERHLDWLVVASPLESQVAALPRTLDLFPPQNVLWSGNTDASFSAEETDRWLASNGVPVTQAYTGAELNLGKGAYLKTISASSRGAVLLVEWEGFKALLPVGVNFDVVDQLGSGKDIGPVTVLLAADSGYGPSNPPEWVKNLQPQMAILSVAAGDSTGLPEPTVLELFKNITLLRTDQNGWIEVSSDGKGYWVDVEKK